MQMSDKTRRVRSNESSKLKNEKRERERDGRKKIALGTNHMYIDRQKQTEITLQYGGQNLFRIKGEQKRERKKETGKEG